MLEIDSTTYEEVINSEKLSIIKFGASWCSPCKILSPILNEIKNDYSDVNFGEIDVDTHSDLAIKNGVKGVPTTIFFKNGKIIDKIVGLQNTQFFKEKINSLK